MVWVAWDYRVGPPYLIWPKHHICQFSNWLTVAIHPQTRPADCIHCNILYCCRSWCNCSVNVNKASINVKVRVCQFTVTVSPMLYVFLSVDMVPQNVVVSC